FSWVENLEIKKLFEFVYSLIKLPSQKNFNSQILSESAQKITKLIKEITQNDKKNSITLAYDVFTMCQIRSKLLYSQNILGINKSLKTYKQKIDILSKNNEQISLKDSKEELLSEDDTDINMRQSQINVEQPELKDDDYMQCDLFSLNESEDNLATKWKLANIFADSLAQSASINLLLGDQEDGKSRCFGFIGYRTEKEANDALNYFNNTFIYTSRITVEHAKPVCDPTLPKPWSAHSIGSSSYQRKHFQKSEANSVEIIKKRVKNDDLNDEKLEEFLEVMKPRSKSKTWANDDLTFLESQQSSKNIITNDSDDELYQDLPNKHDIIIENDTNESNDSKKHNKDKLSREEVESSKGLSVSDMEWIRMKMRRRLDIDDNDDDNDIDVYKSKIFLKDNDDKNNKIDTNPSPENDDSKENNNEKNANLSGRPTEVPPEESIGETGRLFVRNLPYICSEEDLRKVFNKFGPLAEVHIPLDKETKNQKGFAYVLYHIPEHAVKAYIELDNKFFMGRLLHILPSREKPQIRDLNPGRWNLKKKKEMNQKSLASNDFNWTHRFNVKKSEILDPESDNMAAKLALAETHIIQETKSFLEMNGISLSSFGRKEKSDTIILVKNISFGVTKEELQQLFGWYGEIGRVTLIEFLHPSEARNAFTNLAYKKFKGVPLYLEKAPADVFKSETDTNLMPTDDDAKKVLSSTDIIETTINDDDESSEVTATLFVKNINFDTTEEELKKVFKNTPGMRSAKIKMKNDPKNPDGHTLQLKFSNRGLDTVQRKRKEDEMMKKKQESTKIIIKNVAFETTKKELKELFGDARNVMEQLQNTHLLGRHLILEYADDDKNVEELREKIGKEFIADIEGGDGRMRKRKKIDMDDWAESRDDIEE
ncbi:16167_t:CDS:10, partial [Racocetra fulgida]